MTALQRGSLLSCLEVVFCVQSKKRDREGEHSGQSSKRVSYGPGGAAPAVSPIKAWADYSPDPSPTKVVIDNTVFPVCNKFSIELGSAATQKLHHTAWENRVGIRG